MQEQLEQAKIAVALRTARAAVGWSQEELAAHLGIPKTTLARAETMEGGLRADQLSKLMRFYKSLGIDLEFILFDEVSLKIGKDALLYAEARLRDITTRRSDRKSPPGAGGKQPTG